MTNPYDPPKLDTETPADERAWLFPTVTFGLGVLWWAALLVPEPSRELLVRDGTVGLVWGFGRIVGIVVGACMLFRRMRRLWPGRAWLCAIACLWGGTGLYAATVQGLTPEAVLFAFLGPPVFIALAWYVVLPMTILTAVVVTRLDKAAAQRAAKTDLEQFEIAVR